VQSTITFDATKADGTIIDASAAAARICDSLTLISKGKEANFSGTWLGPNILRNMAGHIMRPTMGDTV